MSRRYFVAGNWKMFGSTASNQALLQGIQTGLAALTKVELLVCPPAPYLAAVVSASQGHALAVGGQNLSAEVKEGAHTGEWLGAMLQDIGCKYVIVGHSERRALYGDSDAIVAAKTKAAIGQGLKPIVCVGETLAERESGENRSGGGASARCGAGDQPGGNTGWLGRRV